eukprot:Blabericola_migrator_1__2267@NODE_1627_length_4141_cov_279_934953_g1060_i0_p1_GENE_NODE_1627_length_4141_cov_279_934953_g1060_i0NODE_1627_length_4141_cov_279_934953_g1060_i0_p1_ORF_typecomplete_len592_score112_68FKBP_C/PF00254_28/5_2e07ANAPC3/PF12895_7/1_6e02ANAPC3/PF12895_7/0_16TPR_19/PF14559_6/0_92TPR_19/PF14559_6/28ChAPs/PF09295_10/0_19_NODE_1627_length_4141_cov_279_934953_g1060_i021343909
MSDTTEDYSRQLPGETYDIGPNRSWKKVCLRAETRKPRLRSVDAEAVKVSVKLTQTVDGAPPDVLLDETEVFVHFTSAFDNDPSFAYISLDWDTTIVDHVRTITRTMAPDDVCEVQIAKPKEEVQNWTYLVTLHAAYNAEWPWPVPPLRTVDQTDEELRWQYILPLEEREQLWYDAARKRSIEEEARLKLRTTMLSLVGTERVVSQWKAQRFTLTEVHYTLKCADSGEVIHDTRAAQQPHRFTAGAGDVVPALDLVVRGNLTLGQRGKVLARPLAAFGPYDHSIEAQKIAYSKYLDHMSFMEGYRTVFDGEYDPTRHDREEFEPVRWDRKSEAPIVVPINTDMDPEPKFQLVPSSVDMSQWLEPYEGRGIIFEDLEIVSLRPLPGESLFPCDDDKIEHAAHWKDVGNRYWKIKDYIRAYQSYFQAEHVLKSCDSTAGRKDLEFKCKMNRIVCLGHLEQWTEMGTELTPLFEKNPDNVKIKYWMAKLKLAQDDELSTINLCKSIINVDPHNKDARMLLMEAISQSKKSCGLFNSKVLTKDVLEQTRYVGRDTPCPDWSDVEAMGYDSEMLKEWGLRPTKVVDNEEDTAVDGC